MLKTSKVGSPEGGGGGRRGEGRGEGGRENFELQYEGGNVGREEEFVV